MDADKTSLRLQMKRKQSSDNDEGEPSPKLLTVNNAREYRTAKRRRQSSEQDSDNDSVSLPSSRELSEEESSSDDDWSSWGSDGNDEEEDNKDSKKAKEVTQEANCKNNEISSKEKTVLGSLMEYWTSYTATKASKELREIKTNVCDPSKNMELQVIAIKKLMGLPLVLSVGVEDGRQINVTVSDKKKALESSNELSDPKVNLIEARPTQFI